MPRFWSLILIRVAQPDDYESFCALAAEVDLLHAQKAPRYFRLVSGNHPRSKEYYASVLANKQMALYLAEEDGVVAGYLHIGLRSDPEIPILNPMTYAHISDIVVAEKFQRRGVGRALMDQAKLWAKEKGAKDLRLCVADFNEGAKAFYKSEGFGVKDLTLAMALED